MAPTTYMVSSSEYTEEPISRTYQYRKVMKPLLERKRRARINRCLDELKELMVSTLQSEGENVSKLEKADILELTVRHLHTLKRQHQLVIPNEPTYTDRFRAGFTQCAQEVSQFITSPAEIIEPTAGKRLLQHLGACVQQLDQGPQSPSPQPNQQAPRSPPMNAHQGQPSPAHHYERSYTPPTSPANNTNNQASMWRPW
ncbi:enhancer of split mgamma protein-like [Atheta coriaria]|uniref:enhancer of split mgamma protein-like n=1 Tax=Dalotia coriaria TaxID=877792 RepID=UPI0031F4255D